MNRITKSRKFLEEDLRIVEKDNKFFQQTVRCGLKEIKPYIMTTKHKYGKATSYEYVVIYNYKTHKQTILSYHSFLYAWYKGEVPAGYDVDHIDGDSLNNHIDNLQILTRKENLAKRGGAKNQYYYLNLEKTGKNDEKVLL